MKKQQIILIAIIVIAALILNFTNISVAGGTGCDLELNPSSSSLNPGDEVEITLKITNITVTQGISGISGTLSFDPSAFEVVNYELASTNWKIVQIDPTTLAVSLATVDGAGVTTEQNIAKFKFRVKDSATAKSYNFQITNAESKPVEAQVTQEFQSPITTSVTVKSTSTPTNNTVNNTTVNNTVVNNIVNNTTVNNVVGNNVTNNNVAVNNSIANNNVTNELDNNTNNALVNSNKNSDSNISNTSVPYTGLKVGLGTAVMITLIATIAAGIRYKKYNSIK